MGKHIQSELPVSGNLVKLHKRRQFLVLLSPVSNHSFKGERGEKKG